MWSRATRMFEVSTASRVPSTQCLVRLVFKWCATKIPATIASSRFRPSSIEEHEGDGFLETELYLPDTFLTQESVIEVAIKARQQTIDIGFLRRIASRERVSGA